VILDCGYVENIRHSHTDWFHVILDCGYVENRAVAKMLYSYLQNILQMF